MFADQLEYWPSSDEEGENADDTFKTSSENESENEYMNLSKVQNQGSKTSKRRCENYETCKHVKHINGVSKKHWSTKSCPLSHQANSPEIPEIGNVLNSSGNYLNGYPNFGFYYLGQLMNTFFKINNSNRVR